MRITLVTLVSLAAFALPGVALAQSNTAVGAGSGIVAGALVAGPIGAVVGGVAGGLIGSANEPRRRYRAHRARSYAGRDGRRYDR